MKREPRMETIQSSTPTRTSRGKRRGQSTVELALALPVMLLLLLGTIDIGRAFFDYVQLRNAVREGAGYGARMPNDTAGIVSRVNNHGIPADSNVAVSQTGVCTTTAGKPDGVCTIHVTADHTFTPVTTAFLQNWFGLGPIEIEVTASMRLLR
jgi:Flp pilus assembly protein TadG